MQYLYDEFPREAGTIDDLSTIPADTKALIVHYKTRHQDQIGRFSKLTHLWIGAPDVAALERIARIPTLEFLIISGKVESLPATFKLPRLRKLVLRDVSHLVSIEGLQSLTNVEELSMLNAKKLQDYSPIGALRKLERLELGATQYYERLTIDSLDWIGSLTELRNASISFAKINKGSGRAIAKLTKLKRLFISYNLLPREDFAYFAGALRHCEVLGVDGYVSLSAKCPKCNKEPLVLMIGKRIGMLCRKCGEAKFKRLQSEYEAIVKETRNNNID